MSLWKQYFPPNNLRSIYITLSLSEFISSLTTPFIAFLFFSEKTPLFALNVTNTRRAALFGIYLFLYKLANVICNPIFGSLSDILGRKKAAILTVFGMLIWGISAIAAIAVHSPWTFILGTFIYSLFFAIKPVCTAAINDQCEHESKFSNQALIQFCIGIGVSIGPIIGGYLGHITIFGYYYMLPFIFVFLCSIFLFFYVSLSFKETLQLHNMSHIREHFSFEGLKIILKNRLLQYLLLIHILNQLSWGTYYSFIPAVAKTVFNYQISTVGILLGLIGFCLILTGGAVIPILSKRLSNTNLILVSCVIGTIGVSLTYLGSFFPESSWANISLWLSTLLIAGGDVILFCLLISQFSTSVSKKYQGTIVGFIYTISLGMWSLSALLGSLLMQWKLNGALLICPTSMIILIIFLNKSKNKEWFLSLNKNSNPKST